MANSLKSAKFLIDSRLQDAARGNIEACFELGMVYSSGAAGAVVDLIEAHKWFNLAAISGNSRAQECRAEIAGDMSPAEIAEAQRQARAWMQTAGRA